MVRAGMGESIREQTAQVLNSYSKERKNLIPILQDVQAGLRYLPKEAMLEIAGYLEMSESAVYAVATFYNQFRLSPPGRHNVKICMGTACHIKGGQLILEAWERKLEVKFGGITQDHEFSLERVACVGCCAMAPVVVADEVVHGRVRPTTVEGIIANLKEEHDLRGDSGPGDKGVGGDKE